MLFVWIKRCSCLAQYSTCFCLWLDKLQDNYWYKIFLNVDEKLPCVVCWGFTCDFLPLLLMCNLFHFFSQMDKLVLVIKN